MVPSEAALEVDGVRGADGPVGGELDGTALDKSAGGHDDVGVIARHGPGLRGHVAVYRGGGLDPLAEATMASALPRVTAWMMSWRLSVALGTQAKPSFS